MTSRLSYTSAAESDGEFCGEESSSPRRAGTLKQDSAGRLVRVASDPSLRQPLDTAAASGTLKAEHGDYSLPPPYTGQQEVGGRTSNEGQPSRKFHNQAPTTTFNQEKALVGL